MKKRLFFLALSVAFIFIISAALSYESETGTYDDIHRSYEWYINQGATGPSHANNCGPSSAVMAAKWVYEDFDKSVEDIRQEFTPGDTGWWYTNNIEDFFDKYEIKYSIKRNVKTQKLIKELDYGNIILLCLHTKYITRNQDNASHFGKFYDLDNGHFLIVKGYLEDENGDIYFEVYDPNSYSARNKDKSPKGKNRYYLSTEIEDASSNWWNYYFVIKD